MNTSVEQKKNAFWISDVWVVGWLSNRASICDTRQHIA